MLFIVVDRLRRNELYRRVAHTPALAALWARLRRKRHCINYYVDNGDCRRPVVSADDSLFLGVLYQ